MNVDCEFSLNQVSCKITFFTCFSGTKRVKAMNKKFKQTLKQLKQKNINKGKFMRNEWCTKSQRTPRPILDTIEK